MDKLYRRTRKLSTKVCSVPKSSSGLHFSSSSPNRDASVANSEQSVRPNRCPVTKHPSQRRCRGEKKCQGWVEGVFEDADDNYIRQNTRLGHWLIGTKTLQHPILRTIKRLLRCLPAFFFGKKRRAAVCEQSFAFFSSRSSSFCARM